MIRLLMIGLALEHTHSMYLVPPTGVPLRALHALHALVLMRAIQLHYR